eukprot:PhF_6_TR12968/c0_g1_i2/m.20491
MNISSHPETDLRVVDVLSTDSVEPPHPPKSYENSSDVQQQDDSVGNPLSVGSAATGIAPEESNTHPQATTSFRNHIQKQCFPSFKHVVIPILSCVLLVAALSYPFGYFIFVTYSLPYHVHHQPTWESLSIRDKIIVRWTAGLDAVLIEIFFWMIVMSFFEDTDDDCEELNKHYSWCRKTLRRFSVVIGTIHVIMQNISVVYDFYDPGAVITFISLIGVFWIAHLGFSKQHVEGHKGVHMIFCVLGIAAEILNAYLLRQFLSINNQSWFPWVSPFVLSISAIFTRKAAQVSVIRKEHASKISTLSLCFSGFLQRLAQTTQMPLGYSDVILVEVFLTFSQIAIRLSLYYRHAVVTKVMSGECTLLPKSDSRSQELCTKSVVSELIFEGVMFWLLFTLRFTFQPEYATVAWGFIVLVCYALQMIGLWMTIILVTYFEQVPLELMNPWVLNNAKNSRIKNTVITVGYFLVSVWMVFVYHSGFMTPYWWPHASGFLYA